MKASNDLLQGLMDISAKFHDYRDPPLPKGPWESGEWAVATDAHILLAVPRASIAGELPPLPDILASLFAKWVNGEQHAVEVVSASTILSFVGPLPKHCETCGSTGTIECDECDGSGNYECECTDCGDYHQADCATCDGEGGRPCTECGRTKNRPAMLKTFVIDRNKLGEILDAIDPSPDESVSVSYEKNGLFVFRGQSWWALVSGLREGTPWTVNFHQPATWDTVPVSAGT